MDEQNHRYKEMSDHDLLIRLHTNFENLERNIYRALDSINDRIGKVAAEVESKTDYKQYISDRDSTKKKIEIIDRRVEELEKGNLVTVTKKQVYFDITNWTMKHWAQVMLAIGVASAIIKSIFEQ